MISPITGNATGCSTIIIPDKKKKYITFSLKRIIWNNKQQQWVKRLWEEEVGILLTEAMVSWGEIAMAKWVSRDVSIKSGTRADLAITIGVQAFKEIVSIAAYKKIPISQLKKSIVVFKLFHLLLSLNNFIYCCLIKKYP